MDTGHNFQKSHKRQRKSRNYLICYNCSTNMLKKKSPQAGTHPYEYPSPDGYEIAGPLVNSAFHARDYPKTQQRSNVSVMRIFHPGGYPRCTNMGIDQFELDLLNRDYEEAAEALRVLGESQPHL
jgi:hypothetical protein